MLRATEGGVVLYGTLPAEGSDSVIAVRWGHPLKSQYVFLFNRAGALLLVYVLPEG